MDVALIHWPRDDDRRTELAGRGQPRLLLVEEGAEPPLSGDPLEDWVRLPVSPDDANARVRGLLARTHVTCGTAPILVDGVILHHGSGRLAISTLQARLLQPMIDRFGAVVDREALAGAWAAGPPTTNTIDVTMGRLRRAIAPLGLRIRTVRSRGYALESDG